MKRMALTSDRPLVFLVLALTLLACASLGLSDLRNDPQTTTPLEESQLKRSLTAFQKARSNMDPAQLKMAEDFCKEVGTRKLYKFALKLGSYHTANYKSCMDYLDGVKVLKETGDVDAAIGVLRDATKLSDAELEEKAASLVNEKLVPACETFVSSLKGVYEDEAITSDQEKFAEEVHEHGTREDVQNFVYGRAHYHFCSLLAYGDRTKLIKRIPSRLDEQRRIAIKRLNRLQNQQQKIHEDDNDLSPSKNELKI